MATTVADLKEELDNYGDHLEVAVIFTNAAGREFEFTTIEVDTDSVTGEPRVVLAVEE